MKKLNLFLILILIGVLSACGGGNGDNGDNGDNGASKISKIDIVGAASLFIAPGTTSIAELGVNSVGTVNKLFMITPEGYVQEVTYLDENGDVIAQNLVEPTAIYNVNSTYVIVCFSFNEGYLVRKTDGAVYSLSDAGIPHVQLQFGNFQNAERILTDSSGNIYYQYSSTGEASQVKLAKIDVSDPNNLTKINYLPDTDTPHGFWVTAEGHVVYNYGDGGSNRIKKSNGGIYNLPSYIWMPFWIGLDGKIKYQNPGDGTDKIYTVNIDGSYNVSLTDVAGVSIGQAVSQAILKFSDRILIIDVQWTSGVKEVENPTNNPRNVTIPSISEIGLAVQSESYYYISGTNASNEPLLLRVNPQNDAVTTLINPNIYDIYKMTVSSDNTVTFNALRMSDGVKVLGLVSFQGTITIIDEVLNTEVIALEKIN
jgi:hypothetical protein